MEGKSIDELFSRMSEASSMNDASLHTRLRCLPVPRVKVRSIFKFTFKFITIPVETTCFEVFLTHAYSNRLRAGKCGIIKHTT